ncbi:MAG: ABC transporter ATP-binding protein [Draconibacterium sp.]
MAEPIIQLQNISKKYGDFTAVNDLSLSIEKGEIFGLLGPNGSGKSTTILMMLGLTEPNYGEVKVCGINSTSHPIEVKKRVGYLAEDIGFYDDQTALENLVYSAMLNGIPRKEASKKAEELIERVGLSSVLNKKTGKFSKGMRQRLGLADVLIKDPEVIILDEPTSGIDPKGVQDFLKLVVELRNEHGISILFSSHDLQHVQQVCDRIGIFLEGKLMVVGDIHSLSAKLLTEGRYQIELGADNTRDAGKKLTLSWFQNLAESMNEIDSVSEENGLFKVLSSEDISLVLSKKIMEEGYNLNFLNKKEFGIEAIYNHFMEGETNYAN